MDNSVGRQDAVAVHDPDSDRRGPLDARSRPQLHVHCKPNQLRCRSRWPHFGGVFLRARSSEHTNAGSNRHQRPQHGDDPVRHHRPLQNLPLDPMDLLRLHHGRIYHTKINSGKQHVMKLKIGLWSESGSRKQMKIYISLTDLS